MNLKFKYQCVNCGNEIQTDDIIYLCPKCEPQNKPGRPLLGVLKIIYNYDAIIEDFGGADLFYNLKNELFFDLLPIEQSGSIPGLHIGNTPFYEVDEFDGKPLKSTLFIKNDARNPTLSLKDRASALVSAFAKEKGINKILTASTGNAGSSLAGICAAQGQESVIVVPENAPLAKLTQMLMFGATIIPVKGNYDDAFELSLKLTKETGIYNRNTAYNPVTIEGKKTVAFEIYEQLDGELPDTIFIPVGDGVIISGVYKGFEDLLLLGIIEHIPTIVAVQAEGSPNLVNNLKSKVFKSVKSKTIADSISVDYPSNFYMTSKFIHNYKGAGVLVSDEEILQASLKLARSTGIFAEPAAAAAMAGFLKWHHENMIPDDSSSLVLITGSGLKDLDSVKDILKMPESISCDVDQAKKILGF
jgi:threonine synthase